MADITILKDTLHTKDSDGNEVDLYPKTSDDQVIGLDKYVKHLECGDHTITVTNGDGTIYTFTIEVYNEVVSELFCNDHTITVVNGDGSTYDLEISNELISDEEILALWDIGIDDSRNKYY